MKRADWQKAYAPKTNALEIRVKNTLTSLPKDTRRTEMKKVLSLALVCTLVMASVVALAAGVTFSDRADAVRLANRALAQEYGITEEMQTYFTREIETVDGVTTITYTSMADMQHVLGQYRVVIENGEANVSWSHDGQSTEGELDAHAWGAQQLKLLIEIAKEDQGFAKGYRKAQEIRKEMEDEITVNISTPELNTRAINSSDMAKITVTEEDAIAIAKAAFAAEYGLTQAQLDKMEYQQAYAGYIYAVKDGTTVCEVWFWLHQDEEAYHTEGDGIYRADVNAETGVIEALYYDSALAGNG